MTAHPVIADLRELAALTSTADGAQRLAWGPVWRRAREWFTAKVEALGLEVSRDAAGNNWVTLPGTRAASVIVGGHLDSVPNGGWLDGCLGVLAGLEVLRRYAARRLVLKRPSRCGWWIGPTRKVRVLGAVFWDPRPRAGR
jgi:N-carbamoyl-L-amino-acid hydrolase